MNDGVRQEITLEVEGFAKPKRDYQPVEYSGGGNGGELDFKVSPLFNLQMRLGTWVHTLLEDRFTGRERKTAEKMDLVFGQIAATSVHASEAEIVRKGRNKLAKAINDLEQKIIEALPTSQEPNETVFFAETSFAKTPATVSSMQSELEQPEINDLIKQSGYDGAGDMVATMLKDPIGEISVGDKIVNLEKMQMLVRMYENHEEFSLQKSLSGFDYGLKKYSLTELRLMQLMVGLSGYGYFSAKDEENGAVKELVAQAISRSDLLGMTAEKGSAALAFLRKNKNKLFNTNMLDIERLAEKRGLYSKLLDMIIDGQIRCSLIDLKVSTVDQFTDKSGDTKKINALADSHEIRKKYGLELAHTTQAVVQMVMAMERWGQKNGEMLSILKTNEQGFTKEDIRGFVKFLSVFNKQQFIIARLHFPFLDIFEGSPKVALDYQAMRDNNATASVTKLDPRIDIRHRLTKFYGYMTKRIEERNREREEA